VTASPTSAPTTAEFFAFQMLDAALDAHPWQMGKDDDDNVFMCNDFVGCKKSSPGSRHKWVYADRPPIMLSGEPVITTADGQFDQTTDGSTFTDSTTGLSYYAPYACQCSAE